MSELDRLIRARIDTFVEELGELVRRAALEAVADALGGKRAAAKPAARPKARAKQGGKRSASELESLSERIQRFVADAPGSGARDIAKGLGISTRDLVLPVKKLVAAGALCTKGQRRATKYYKGKKG